MGTETATIRLTKPAVGGDLGPLWPNDLNLDMDLIDRAINQTVTVNAADVNVVLTADGTNSDQALYAIYSITGAWTANRTITLPSCVKIGYCINATSGGHNVVLSAGGTTLSVPPGANRVRFEVDGSNNITSPFVSSGSNSVAASGFIQLPGGLILNWGVTTTPAGGAVAVPFSQNYASQCFAVIATTVPSTPPSTVSVLVASASSFNATTYQSGVPTGAGSFYWVAIGL